MESPAFTPGSTGLPRPFYLSWLLTRAAPPARLQGNGTVECAHYRHATFLEDAEFAALLRDASWVPVLRRWEGFEMMGVEALFSGTRPVVYDHELVSQPYRWFKGHAAIVQEGSYLVNVSSPPSTGPHLVCSL
jgi:hypothetical protein